MDWRELDRRDIDLGGTAAIPIKVVGAPGRKLIFTIGKSGEAYLLDRDNLGGVGGALASARVTTNIAITSPAVWSAADGAFVILQGDGAYCPRGEPADGLIALKISVDPAPVIETAWCGSVVRAGSPIVTTTDGRSDPIVLVVGAEGDNRLHALRADTGEPLATPPETLRGLHHFQTLIAAKHFMSLPTARSTHSCSERPLCARGLRVADLQLRRPVWNVCFQPSRVSPEISIDPRSGRRVRIAETTPHGARRQRTPRRGAVGQSSTCSDNVSASSTSIPR